MGQNSVHRDIYVASCYRPNVADKTFTSHLRKSLDNLSSKRPESIIIGGDFNLPGWNWSDLTLKPGTTYATQHTEFRDLLENFGLTQCVLEPTRRSNTLDLIATNLPDRINRVKVIPGISDHEIVFMELSVHLNYRKQPRKRVWMYNKADWPGMIKYLGPRMARFEEEYNPCPDALWNKIQHEITEAMETFIPRRLTKRKDSRPWIDKKLHRLIKTKRRLYKKCKKRGSTHLEPVQKLLRKQHAHYVHRIFTDSDKTSAELSKRFWKYVKHKRSAAISTVGPLKQGNRLVTSAKEKA